ncbi:MAG: diguanylate cyclase [Kineosporiaceae bacterium]
MTDATLRSAAPQLRRRSPIGALVETLLHSPPVGDDGRRRLSEMLGALDYESAWHPTEAISAAQSAEAVAWAQGWFDLVTQAQAIRVGAQLRRGELFPAAELARRVLARVQEQGQILWRARLHSILSQIFRSIGDTADCLNHAVLCMSHTPDDAPRWVRVTHLLCLGTALHVSGSYDDAFARYEEALELADSLEDRQLSTLVLNNMTYGSYERDDAEAARRYATRLTSLAAEHRLPLYAEVLDTLARVEMMHCRLAEAEALLLPAVADPYGQLFIEPDALPCLLLTLAEIRRERGDLEAVAATLDLCERVALERGVFQWHARLRRERALLHAAQGHFQAAFEESMAFHDAWVQLHNTESETRARVVHALYELNESQRARDQFHDLATRDPLTGLHNRRHSDALLPTLVAGVDADHPLSIAILDIDHFKRINDTYSHEIGDRTLQRTADLLADFTPAGGASVRLGGEEFLLLMPDTPAVAAQEHCERLREAFTHNDWTPVLDGVTVSIGLTTVTDDDASPSALLSRADRHLYVAKRGGRNRVVTDPTS